MDDGSTCMLDYDGDYYGDDDPSNSNIEIGTDCDDGDVYVFPGEPN